MASSKAVAKMARAKARKAKERTAKARMERTNRNGPKREMRQGGAGGAS